MAGKTKDITEIAAKQRHLALLTKVKSNQPLTKSELTELEQYERKAPVKTFTPIKPAKRLKKRSTQSARRTTKTKAKHFPISLIRIRRLGYRCRDLAHADYLAGTRRPLAAIFKTYPRLKAEWRRGKLLRKLSQLGRTMTVTEAATQLRHLKYPFETGQDFRDFMDGDPEADDVWRSAWVAGAIENRRNLFATAKQGNAAAIKMIDTWYKDGAGEGSARVDFEHLRLKDVAALFGVTRETAGDWHKTRGLPRNGDNSFDLKTTIRWFRDYTLKKAAGRAPVSSQSPFQDVKTEMARFKLAEERGEYVTRASAIAFQIGCMEKVTAAFVRIPDYANRMHAQPREQIIAEIEGLRDDVTAALQQIPAQLKLSPAATETLRLLYEQIAPRREGGAAEVKRQK